MRKVKLILLFLVSVINVYATNYYVSNSGSDTNPGTLAAPWKSITKVNASMSSFLPGDSVLFKRGEEFYGALYLTKSGGAGSPIVFGAYGVGEKPIITGLSTVFSWTNVGTNLWEASVLNAKADLNIVSRNNTPLQVGRYPNVNATNGGYITYTGVGGSTSPGGTATLTTNAIIPFDFSGGIVVVRKKRWNHEQDTVISTVGTLTTYKQPVGLPNLYAGNLNYGLFFERHPSTLDQQWEWYFNNSTKKLRVFSTTNPGILKVATLDTLVTSVGRSYITLENLQLVGANRLGLSHTSCNFFLVKKCDFKLNGQRAAIGWYSTNSSVDSSTAKHNLGSSFYFKNNTATSANLSITYCTIDSTAMISGMEIPGDAEGRCGITVLGNGVSATNNLVTYSGFAGIEYQGNNVSIRRNVIKYFCLRRDDGGAIYTFEAIGSTFPTRTNRVVNDNIILYGVGNNFGTDEPNGSSARGVYLDEGTRTVTVGNNTVAYCNGAAIYGNSLGSLSILDNVCYSNKYSTGFQRLKNAPLIRNLTIRNNVFYPYYFFYRNLQIEAPTLITGDSDVNALGVLDYNYYYSAPTNDTSLFRMVVNSTLTVGNSKTDYRSMSYLKSTTKIERNSYRVNNNNTPVRFFANETDKAIVISLPVGTIWKDVRTGLTYTCCFSLDPFESVILYQI